MACRWLTSVNCMKNLTLASGGLLNIRSVFWALGCLILGACTLFAEQKLDELETEGETYYKVTVTSKTPTHVFISHSKGFANIKVESLSDEVKAQLGYKVAKVEDKSQAQLGGLEQIPLDPETAAARDKLFEDLKTQFSGLERNVLYGAGGALFVLYLFGCLCCKLICEKAGFKAGLMAWIPGFQMLALFKAARMGTYWFLLFISPLATPLAVKPIIENFGPEFLVLLFSIPSALSMIASVIWCFKICIARGITAAAGILLLLPGLNLLTFLYLAFSAGNANLPVTMSKEDAKRWTKVKAQDTSFFMNS